MMIDEGERPKEYSLTEGTGDTGKYYFVLWGKGQRQKQKDTKDNLSQRHRAHREGNAENQD